MTLSLAVAMVRVGGRTRADSIEMTPLTIRRYVLYIKYFALICSGFNHTVLYVKYVFNGSFVPTF